VVEGVEETLGQICSYLMVRKVGIGSDSVLVALVVILNSNYD